MRNDTVAACSAITLTYRSNSSSVVDFFCDCCFLLLLFFICSAILFLGQKKKKQKRIRASLFWAPTLVRDGNKPVGGMNRYNSNGIKFDMDDSG